MTLLCADFNCYDCDKYPTMFMVHDHVWCVEAGLPKRGCVLCLDCFERVLGRRLTLDDLTICPVNEPFRVGYEMARRDAAAPHRHHATTP